MAAILRYASICFVLVGAVIIVSALVGGTDGLELSNFILGALTCYISISLHFAFRGAKRKLNRVEGCFLLVVLWIFLPLPVSLALMSAVDLSLVDAYFEAVSGLTTTGASVFTQYEELPASALLLRAITQWAGGLLTLLGVFLVLAPAGLGGLPPRQTVVTGSITDTAGSEIRGAAAAILIGYLLVTMVCFILLSITQVPVFQAFLLSMTTISSGGFVFFDTPLFEIGTPYSLFVLAAFMIIAGSSVVWLRLIFLRRVDLLKRHREVYFFALAIVALGIVFSLTFFERAGSVTVLGPFAATGEGFFTAISLLSTTGFEIRNGSFGVLPATVVLMIVLIGGCSFSTAGGISFYRLGGMFVYSFKDLAKLVYPSSVQSTRFGSQRYNISLMKAIWTYFFCVAIVTMLGTAFLALRLDSFEAALIACIAAFSNIGAFYATGWSETGLWTRFDEMDNVTKLVLCSLMILGRLHVLALLTAFNRTYWLR